MTTPPSTKHQAPFESPHLIWFLLIIPAMSFLALLSFHDATFSWWQSAVTSFFSRPLLQGILIVAVMLHVGEAGFAWLLATRLHLEDAALRWALQTFALGYPSLRLLLARRTARA